MRNPVEVIIQGNVPSKSNSYKVIPKGLIKSNALKRYEESFFWQSGAIRDQNIDTPFEIELDVFYPSKRSDLDGCLKVVLDCLQHTKTITNDNNCCKIIARKFIDKQAPRIKIKITPI
ncbi:MAG: RusA family crossover junction endodeoxyribonuclease [Bacteroidales bacterium]